MFTANIVPGQGFQPFTVYEKSTTITDTGRAVTGGYTASDKHMYGILTNASQKEVDQWKQNGHPVSHKIVQYSAMNPAKATDYLIMDNGRKFYVQGIKNHADMNISISYYVEERSDIK